MKTTHEENLEHAYAQKERCLGCRHFREDFHWCSRTSAFIPIESDSEPVAGRLRYSATRSAIADYATREGTLIPSPTWALTLAMAPPCPDYLRAANG